jgi:hypothetical protein
MKTRTLTRWLATLATALAIPWLAQGCGGKAAGGSSNTNWMHDCRSDQDCGTNGLSCECGICTRPCDSSGCGHLSKSATCVTPSTAASRRCGADRLGALCTVACAGDGDCRSFGDALQCLDGACLSPPPEARDAGVDSSGHPIRPDATVPPPSPDATVPPEVGPPVTDGGGNPVDHGSRGSPNCSFPDTSIVLASPVVPDDALYTDDAALAVDDDYVWLSGTEVRNSGPGNPVASPGTLRRVPRCGGSLEVVLDAPGVRKPLINIGEYLYWPTETGIRRFTKATFRIDSIDLEARFDGGVTEKCLVDMVARDDRLYFLDNCRRTIELVPAGRLAHQAIVVDAPADDIPPGGLDRHIAVSDTDVYWVVGGGIHRAALQGGTKATVLSSSYAAVSVAAIGSRLFAGVFEGADPGTLETTLRGPGDAGSDFTDLDTGFLHALITSDPYLFWASGTAAAPKVMRLDTTPAAGGGLASPQIALGAGKVDLKMLPAAYGNRLYWVAKNGRDLMTAVQD